MESRVRIALFGGSFNPIHAGHVGIAEKAISDWSLDRVLFIPAKVNPFKAGQNPADLAGGFTEAERWDFVVRVCRTNPKFEAWDIDLKRPDGPSYAIDTVRAARLRFPGAAFYWIIGEDNVEGLPRWKDWETLKTLVQFIAYPHTRESSTEIRARRARGEAFAEFLPSCLVDD